ncbi:hypothetical protein ACIBBD_16755 [Streptomyces sp. NPDC051315]|uniref:hypothetical protein n=1 Tax=Streptomyces sp. NPDC051315 TaxID=3365650 RepID=UPI0037A0DA19
MVREASGRPHPDYTDRHEEVFRALTAAEERHGGEGIHLEEISRLAGIGPEETRGLLDELTREHRLVTELAGTDRPDLGPRFGTKPRL